MMKKKRSLTLSRETLHHLENRALGRVPAGGVSFGPCDSETDCTTFFSYCPSIPPTIEN